MKAIEYTSHHHLSEHYTEERCYIAEIFNHADDRSHSLARCRVQPGITTAWHSLKSTSEIYYILQGQGLVELGDAFQQKLVIGDSVYIPADMPQRITNTSDQDLIFLCICRPAFEVSCYQEIQ